jgi:site-specific DNA recombinase
MNRGRYFLYARKSSEPDDRQALSIESQKKELLSRFGHFTIVEIIEESRTAKEPGRPQFEAMMKRLERGEADGLIAWHPDRLSRNSVDAGRIIYDLDLGKIQDLKFAGYNFENSPEGKWMLSVILSQSKYFVDKLSKDVRRGLKMKLEMGWRPGVAPIGYLNNLADHKGLRTIVPDPERFPLVRRMWDLMLTGAYSPPRIMEIAAKEWGFRTLERRKRGGTPLSKTGTYSLFSNPFYTGVFEYDGQIYQGQHTPMISESEFWKVQALLGRKGRPRPKTRRDFAFTGLMRCGECGCGITAEEKVKFNKTTGQTHKYLYYHCTKKKRYVTCRQPSIENRNLEAQFSQALLHLTVNEDFLEWALQYLEELRENESGASRLQQDGVERAYKGSLRQLDELLSIRLRGLIDDGEFEAKRRSLLQEQMEMKANLDNPAEKVEKVFEQVERTCRFALHLKSRFENGTLQEKRIILENVGSNLRLQDKILYFEPVAPFECFKNVSKKSKWRGIVQDVRTFCRGATNDWIVPANATTADE